MVKTDQSNKPLALHDWKLYTYLFAQYKNILQLDERFMLSSTMMITNNFTNTKVDLR